MIRVADVQEPPAVLRFERRRGDRIPVRGAAAAFVLEGEDFGRRHALELVDWAPGGVGARCETPIAPGTAVTVALDRPMQGVDRGVVVRCLPCGRGYRIAIAYAARRAA